MSAARFTESTVEDATVTWLEAVNWRISHGADIAPDMPAAERRDNGEVVLAQRLRDALAQLNPLLPADALEDAFRKVTRPKGANLVTRNRQLHRFIVDGVTVQYRHPDGRIAGAQVRVIDFDEPAYAPLAFREAVANAICHRDYASGGSSIGVAMYDDRLEVTSSGTLHFGFTPQALFEPHESRPWNPLIAGVFYRRGIIEAWGQGTLKMAAWSEEAGLPKPEILEIPGAVVVRFRGKTTGKTTGKTPLAVLHLLAEDPSLTVSQLAARLEKAELTIHRAIRSLRESGRLQRIGPDKGGHWKVIE